MKGSASIEKVLPAILHESKFLLSKYGGPIYGSDGGIKSLNFKNQTWLRTDPKSGEILVPYDSLPPVFSRDEERAISQMFADDEAIANGGSAMMAYAKTQFTDMSDAQANMIFDALLRYCELDTLAMVMLVEYWFDEMGRFESSKRKASC